HRSSGGRIWPLDAFRAAVEAARSRGAAVHLDGARLFNAPVAARIDPSACGAPADAVTIRLSKGLGCPLGAILAGPAEPVEPGWRRAVTHLDVGDEEIEQAIERMQEVLSVHV